MATTSCQLFKQRQVCYEIGEVTPRLHEWFLQLERRCKRDVFNEYSFIACGCLLKIETH